MATGTLPPEYAQIVRGGLRYKHGDNFSTPEAQSDLRMVQRFKQNPQDPEALQFINQLTQQAEWGNPQTGGHMAMQGTLGGIAAAPFLTKMLSLGKLAPHPMVKGASHLAGLALGGYGAYNLADAQTRKEYELPDTDFQNFLGMADLAFAPFDAAALKKHGLGSFFKGRPTEAPNPNAIDPEDLADTSQKNFGLGGEPVTPDVRRVKGTGTTSKPRISDDVVSVEGRKIPDARRVEQPAGRGWGPTTKPKSPRRRKMKTPQPGKLPWDIESAAANKSIWKGAAGVKRKGPVSQSEQSREATEGLGGLESEVSGEAKGIGETLYSGEKQTFKTKGAATEQPVTPQTQQRLKDIEFDEDIKVDEWFEREVGLQGDRVQGHVPEIQVELDAAWRRYQDDVTKARTKKKEPKAGKDGGIEISEQAELDEAARVEADALKKYQDEVTAALHKWKTASPDERARMARSHHQQTKHDTSSPEYERAARQLEGVEGVEGLDVTRPDPLPSAPPEGAARRQRPGSYETRGGQRRSTGPQAGRDHQGATTVKRRKRYQEAEEPVQPPLTGLPLEMPPTRRPTGGGPKPEYKFDPTAEPSSGRTAGRAGPDPEEFEIQGVRDASRGGRAGRIGDYSEGDLNQILERLEARVEKTRSAGAAADTEILEETIYQIKRALRLRSLGMSNRVL